MNLRSRLSLAGLVALLAGSGFLHFLAPRSYQRIVPAPLVGWRGPIVTISGAAEIACAALLIHPRSRRLGAWAAAALLLAVFPANVQMALDGGYPDAPFPGNSAVGAWLRLPIQAPLIWWALSFRHRARRSS